MTPMDDHELRNALHRAYDPIDTPPLLTARALAAIRTARRSTPARWVPQLVTGLVTLVLLFLLIGGVTFGPRLFGGHTATVEKHRSTPAASPSPAVTPSPSAAGSPAAIAPAPQSGPTSDAKTPTTHASPSPKSCPPSDFQVTISLDHTVYQQGQSVVATSVLRNVSSDYCYPPSDVTAGVTDAQGHQVGAAMGVAIDYVAGSVFGPGGTQTQSFDWDAYAQEGQEKPGTYTDTFTWRGFGSASATFRVVAAPSPSPSPTPTPLLPPIP